jgi:hypothetical protein
MSGSQSQSSVAPPRSVQANLKNTRAGASVLALCFASPIMVVGPFFAYPFFFDAARDLSCPGAGQRLPECGGSVKCGLSFGVASTTEVPFDRSHPGA